MLLDKNLRLPGTSLWARFVNGGLTWLTLALYLASAGVVFAANAAAKLIILPAPALLVARTIASGLYLYFIGGIAVGGIAVVGAHGMRRNLREWHEEGATLRLRLRRGLYWVFLIVYIAWIAYLSSMISALLWLTWASNMLPWVLPVGLYGLMPSMFLVLLLFMATYLPRKWLRKWLSRFSLQRWRQRSRAEAPDPLGE